MWVHELRDADPSCGGKAVGLGRLIRAGLPVPPGFVIDDGAFRSIVGDLSIGVLAERADDTASIGHVLAAAAERIATAVIPPELEAEVRERARELGHLLAVRSSATIEDSAAGAGAGVFSSRRAVPVADVWDAIRAVWTSALTPLAAAYARRRGGGVGAIRGVGAMPTIAIGVIVQEYVAGTPVVVYTRPPGQPTSPELLVQRADHVSRCSRDDLPREIETQHAAVIALRAEQAIDAPQGADVELVQIRKQHGFDVAIETAVVQARAIVHPTARVLSPPPPAVLAVLDDGRVWNWDAAHNPDPLSTAQQGLVERVERAGSAPWSLRVCGGFLYSASRGEPLPTVTNVGDFGMRAAELEARLERMLAHDAPLSPNEAIERYLAFYAIWARELAPLIAAARKVLPAELEHAGHPGGDTIAAMLIGSPDSTVESMLLGAARGELEERDVELSLGCLAPAWDVAVPTFAERPGLLRDAIARAAALIERTSVRTPATLASVPDELASTRRHSRVSLDEIVATEPFQKTRPDSSHDEIETQPLPKLAPAEDDLVTLPPLVRRFPAAELLERLAREHHDAIALARCAAEIAERDDTLFARAQLLVRRALLTRAAELGLRSDDIFWLPLDETAAVTSIDPADAHRRASGARSAAERAAQWQMPIVVGGDADGALPDTAGTSLRGVGTGPRVAGRVVRFASLASAVAVGAGDVIVTRAVTPALAVLVAGCAALVSETGGLLDHGAALARELGIPCVVGCRDAWTLLTDGMLVTVDGDAGTITQSSS